MDKQELFEARTNPDFLKYLEEARVNSINAKDIGLMYETLDSMLILDLDEEKINELYSEILKTAFENVQKIVTKDEKLSLEGDNLLNIRALYEHAIEKWSMDNFEGARDLIFVTANIIEDEKLEKALNVLLVVLSNNESLDNFYDEKVNLNMTSDDETYGYFIVDFNFDTDEFLSSNKELLKTQYEKLKHLLGK